MLIGAMNHPQRNPYEEIEWIGENGFDFIDFTMEGKTQVGTIEPQRMKNLLDRYNLKLMGHMGWYLPVASSFPSLRRAAKEEVSRAVEFLKEMDSKWICIHTQFTNEGLPLNEWIHIHREFIGDVHPICRSHDIGLLVENTPNFKYHSIDRILRPFPDVYLNFDIAHAYLSDGGISHFMKNLSKKIRHLHLSDNWGRDDQHLPLGAGKIDWKSDIREIHNTGYRGGITLEIFSPDRDYLLISRQKVKRFIDERLSG